MTIYHFRFAPVNKFTEENKSSWPAPYTPIDAALAATEGTASNTDFAAWNGFFGSGGGGSLGGYTNTPEGKVLAGAFADAYNRLVGAVRNYRAQEVKGGLGTGGALGVQGGTTPASQAVESPAPAPATKPTARSATKPAPQAAPKK